MIKFLKKLFQKILNFLKKILELLKDILPILIVLAIVFFPAILAALAAFLPAGVVSALGGFGTWVAGLTAWELTALSVGTAAVLAPEETGKILGSVTENVGEVAEDVVKNSGGIIDAATDLLGGVTSSIFGAMPTWVWVAAAGVGLYMLTSSSEYSPIIIPDQNGDEQNYGELGEEEFKNGSTL